MDKFVTISGYDEKKLDEVIDFAPLYIEELLFPFDGLESSLIGISTRELLFGENNFDIATLVLSCKNTKSCKDFVNYLRNLGIKFDIDLSHIEDYIPKAQIKLCNAFDIEIKEKLEYLFDEVELDQMIQSNSGKSLHDLPPCLFDKKNIQSKYIKNIFLKSLDKKFPFLKSSDSNVEFSSYLAAATAIFIDKRTKFFNELQQEEADGMSYGRKMSYGVLTPKKMAQSDFKKFHHKEKIFSVDHITREAKFRDGRDL